MAKVKTSSFMEGPARIMLSDGMTITCLLSSISIGLSISSTAKLSLEGVVIGRIESAPPVLSPQEEEAAEQVARAIALGGL